MTTKVLGFSSMKGLRNCLRRGLGVTLCPEVAIRRDLDAGTLAVLPWTGFDDDNDASVGRKGDSRQAPSPAPCEAGEHEAAVVMIWHQDKWCSPLLRRFMELAESAMAA